MSGPKYQIGQPVPPSARRRKTLEPFKRVLRTEYDDDGEGYPRIRYFHATKGWRDREATPELMRSMMSVS